MEIAVQLCLRFKLQRSHKPVGLVLQYVLHPLQSCLKAALLTKQSLDRLRSASLCSNFHTVQQLTSQGR